MTSLKISRMPGGALGARGGRGFVVRAPGCPDESHPLSWCGCKMFRTYAEAVEYAKAGTK